MFDDDECYAIALTSRECEQCHGILVSFAFPQSEQDLFMLRELQKKLGTPIFALMDKDAALNRARVVVFHDTVEAFFLTPKEFHRLVRQYLARHACASWN
jgi:hypothetical protein